MVKFLAKLLCDVTINPYLLAKACCGVEARGEKGILDAKIHFQWRSVAEAPGKGIWASRFRAGRLGWPRGSRLTFLSLSFLFRKMDILEPPFQDC